MDKKHCNLCFKDESVMDADIESADIVTTSGPDKDSVIQIDMCSECAERLITGVPIT
jgi:hypothetical protein